MIGHWISAIFLLLLGIIGIWLSTSLPVETSEELGTSFFPFLISIFLLILSLINLANLFRREKASQPIRWPEHEGWVRMGLTIFLFSGYIGILERLGFMISTFLLILLFARLIFQKSWVASGTLAVLAVLSAFGLLTELLGVRLPASPWKWI
jgi:putative tricarboxylic transport membrane protein